MYILKQFPSHIYIGYKMHLNSNCCSHQLLKKHKTLRSSFKIFDQNRSGFIEETELRTSLGQLGYALSDQDFLDILQVFDRSQAQRVSFDDFKTTLLTL